MKVKRKWWRGLIAVGLVLGPMGVGAFSGRVVGVSDGDTLVVMDGQKSRRVRLYGIDCPEKRQAFGQVAKKFTSELVFGKVVEVRVEDEDRYKRLVARVIMEDGRSLNELLVREGLAWWYERYAPGERVLKELEAEARREKRGLWKERATPPWEWRRERP